MKENKQKENTHLVKLLKSNHLNQIANIITSFRILCGICLLFCSVFSASFYAFYILGGFTDMIDGTVARKTNSVSKYGAEFDTVADIVFVFASLLKVLPVIQMSRLLWIWCGIIAVIKICNIVSEIISKKKFLTQHTVANKITGLFLFLLPFAIQFFEIQYIIPIVGAMATFSAIQEAYYISAGIEL